MKSARPKYPIGDQSFLSVRSGGYLYVDKSMYIEELLMGSRYYFLSRPRRFGKSLFLSMLKFFFEGRRDLFKGLYADTLDWNWEPYPVLYLDLNTQQYHTDEDLDLLLDNFLSQHEALYEVTHRGGNYSIRFANIIKAAKEKTGKEVVILIDEYDKPLVNNIHHARRFDYYRNILLGVYSNLKSSADYIRLVFITGVSRFGKLSVFSGLNNIMDISFDRSFSAICGITSEELLENFRVGIKELAEEADTESEEEVKKLKSWYDGYHFSVKSPDIYNPYSILNALAKKSYGYYWIESGTPQLLLEQIQCTDVNLHQILNAECTQEDLQGLDISNLNIIALLYQTGYLTIKHYDKSQNIFTLGLPNEEVKRGFFEYLLPYYGNTQGDPAKVFVIALKREIEQGNVKAFMTRLTAFFAGISYEMRMDEERNVQNAMLILFKLIGLQTDVEYRTGEGRIDILIRTDNYVYIIELKFNASATQALNQILQKRYALPWSVDKRKVILIGINYSSACRGIDDWKAEVNNSL